MEQKYSDQPSQLACSTDTNKSVMRLIRVALWLIISLLCVSTSGLGQRVTDPVIMSQPLTKKLIDSMERALNRFYIFPDKAALMSKKLQTQFKQGRYRTITNPNKLAAQLGHDLQSVYADGHMFVRYDPDFARELTDIDPKKRRIEDSLALIDAVDQNFGLNKVEILDGNTLATFDQHFDSTIRQL